MGVQDFIKRHKYIFGGLVIFLIVFCALYVGILYMHEVVVNNNIRSEVVNVTDKYYAEGKFNNYYLISTDKNVTYSISNIENDYSQRLYDKIQIGHTYRFILQEPDVMDNNQYIHILQVHNATQ